MSTKIRVAFAYMVTFSRVNNDDLFVLTDIFSSDVVKDLLIFKGMSIVTSLSSIDLTATCLAHSALSLLIFIIGMYIG